MGPRGGQRVEKVASHFFVGHKFTNFERFERSCESIGERPSLQLSYAQKAPR